MSAETDKQERDAIALQFFLSDRLPKTERWDGGGPASPTDDVYHAYQMADAFLDERARQGKVEQPAQAKLTATDVEPVLRWLVKKCAPSGSPLAHDALVREAMSHLWSFSAGRRP